MAGHFHAVVWIDHKQARVFHFNVEEADRTVVRDHIVRDIRSQEKRTGHRIEENKPFFEDVAKAIADAGAILIVGPAQREGLLRQVPRREASRDPDPYRGRRECGPSGRRRAFGSRAPLRQSRRPHAAADLTLRPAKPVERWASFDALCGHKQL
jgi:hypothetical protein